MNLHFGMELQVQDASFSTEFSRMLFETELGIILTDVEESREELVQGLLSDPSSIGAELLKQIWEAVEEHCAEMQLSDSVDLSEQQIKTGFGVQLMAGKGESGELVLLMGGLMEIQVEIPGLTAGDLVKASAPGLAAVLACAALRVLMIDLLGLQDVEVEFEGFGDDGEPSFSVEY